MGKGAAKREVVEYRMSAHLGFGMRVDRVRKIKVNDKLAWDGDLTEGRISIHQPNLFGGNEKEGGLVGAVEVLTGAADQLMPEDLAQRLGKTSATCPAFRGKFTLFFVGSGAVSNPNRGGFFQALASQAGAAPGFMWSMNSPLLAQSVWAETTTAPVAPELNPAYAMIGDGANGVHIIYECYVDQSFGIGESPAMMDVAAYEAAAQTVWSEGLAISAKWTEPTEVEDFIKQVLNHIQAVAFLDPRTGLHTIKLLRDDYDPDDLFELTPDNCKLTKVRRRLDDEIVNEVTVKWTNPLTEKEETVTVQNPGSVDVHGVSSTEHAYPFFRDVELATKAAARDVTASSAPLISTDAVVDRSFWDKLPGDVVKLTFPKYKIFGAIMRVGKVGIGKPGDSAIRVPLMQDVFSLNDRPIEPGPGSEWIDPAQVPAPMASTQILTIPSFFAMTGGLSTEPVPLIYPEVLAVTLGYQPGYDTPAYDLRYEAPSAEGELVSTSGGIKQTIERATLDVALAPEAQSFLPIGIIINPDRGPRPGGFVFIGGGDTASEIAQVIGYEESEESWLIGRGVLDTIPRDWPIGTPVWFVNAGSSITDTKTIRSAGETATFQYLSQTSLGQLALEDAPDVTATLTERPHMPLRPANVAVNGTKYGSYSAAAATDLVFTWATRNRDLEAGQTVAWDAASMPPEYRQKTVLKVFDGATEIIRYQFWTDDDFTLPKSELAKWASVRVEFWSERDGVESLQHADLTITGLANNPAAPAPTPQAPLGEPPSPVTQPSIGAFVVTGTEIPSGVGTVIPVLIVAGQQDSPDNDGLVIRYRRATTTAWMYHEQVFLDLRPIRTVITGVAPLTSYEVEVAYVVDNVLGNFRGLGTHTTGDLVANNTVMLGERLVEDVLEELETLRDDVSNIVSDADDALNGGRLNAKTLLEQAVATWEDDVYRTALSFINGERLGPIILRHDSLRQSGDEALAQTMSLIGAATVDGLAFVLDLTTAKVSPTETLGQRFSSIETTSAGLSSAITTEQTSRIAGDAALSLLITTLTSTVNTNHSTVTSSISNEAVTRANADTALNGLITTLTSTVNNNFTTVNASISAEAVTRANADSAIAGTVSTLTTTVTNNYNTLDAAISAEAVTRANGDSAVAATVTSLTAVVNGNTSSITTLNSVTSDINGRMSAVHSVTLDINGRWTGFKLMTSGGGGTIVSYFDIYADYFRVFNGSSSVPMFEVSGGAAYIAGNRVRTESALIGAFVRMSADQVVGEAATCVSRGSNPQPSNRALVQSFTFTVDTTGKVVIDFFCQCEFASANIVHWFMKVVTMEAPVWGNGNIMTNADYRWQSQAGFEIYLPSLGKRVYASGLTPGTHTVEIYFNSQGSNSHAHKAYDPLITVAEHKRSS